MRKSSRDPIALAMGATVAFASATAQASMTSALDQALSPTQRELLLQKTAEDPAFRVKLLRDPKAAAREFSIVLPDAESERILQGTNQVRRNAEVAAYPLPKLAGSPKGQRKPKQDEKQQKSR